MSVTYAFGHDVLRLYRDGHEIGEFHLPGVKPGDALQAAPTNKVVAELMAKIDRLEADKARLLGELSRLEAASAQIARRGRLQARTAALSASSGIGSPDADKPLERR